MIWEREGSPERRDVEHWFPGRAQIANGEDAPGLKRGVNNNDGVKKIKRSGRIEKDGEEAQTLYGKEKDEVQRTEEVGRGPAEARTRVTSGIDGRGFSTTSTLIAQNLSSCRKLTWKFRDSVSTPR